MDDNIYTLYNIYKAVYNDQLCGADEDYLEYFEDNFAPPEQPWDTKDEAASAMQSLIGELCEDRTDVGELLENCGLTQGLIDLFGLTI